MNAYAISLSKYVNTGLIAVFTLLAYLGFFAKGPRLRRFIEILRSHGINVTVRRRLGPDINASCGQLRRKYEKKREQT